MRPQGFGQTGAGLEDLGWNDMGFDPPKPHNGGAADDGHDAFGEVIPAHPHNLAGLTPVESPVHNQQAEIADRLSSYEPSDGVDEEEVDETAELYDPEAELEEVEAVVAKPVPAIAPKPVAAAPKPQPAAAPRRVPRPRSAPGAKGKAAFTLRLDPERHLKLRLACAVDGRSAQMLVTDALDRLLDEMPELETLAEKAKRKG